MRTNEQWITQLSGSGPTQTEAIEALSDYLFRAVLLYLQQKRPDLNSYTHEALRQLASDFTQEAVTTILAKLDTFQGNAKFTTWAYRFVINAAASELRRRYYRERLSLESLSERETTVILSLATNDPKLDPDLESERKHFVAELLQIIQANLNERQRFALLGVYFEERSMQEIAEHLDVSANTVYKMLYDARQKVKKALEARHFGAGDILALFESRW